MTMTVPTSCCSHESFSPAGDSGDGNDDAIDLACLELRERNPSAKFGGIGTASKSFPKRASFSKSAATLRVDGCIDAQSCHGFRNASKFTMAKWRQEDVVNTRPSALCLVWFVEDSSDGSDASLRHGQARLSPSGSRKGRDAESDGEDDSGSESEQQQTSDPARGKTTNAR